MRRLTPLLILVAAGFAPAPPPKASRSEADLKKMQGAWRLVEATEDGQPLSLRHLRRYVEVVGDRLKYEGTRDTLPL
jgi:hypothetical protein